MGYRVVLGKAESQTGIPSQVPKVDIVVFTKKGLKGMCSVYRNKVAMAIKNETLDCPPYQINQI